jgi:hypothetical protein
MVLYLETPAWDDFSENRPQQRMTDLLSFACPRGTGEWSHSTKRVDQMILNGRNAPGLRPSDLKQPVEIPNVSLAH